ncbi:unnamed protein product [Prorocentrum cordatum]|uniref:Secreted protein n=1 Tax=Prorocentrum cordatum TaxID=2364126 RepID=A0ABN9WU50_9DINO|nr:unnamed protein product [Polarella glacialis]
MPLLMANEKLETPPILTVLVTCVCVCVCETCAKPPSHAAEVHPLEDNEVSLAAKTRESSLNVERDGSSGLSPLNACEEEKEKEEDEEEDEEEEEDTGRTQSLKGGSSLYECDNHRVDRRSPVVLGTPD